MGAHEEVSVALNGFKQALSFLDESGVADSLIDLFMPGDDGVMDALDAISKQIDDFRADMNSRFD